MSGIYETAQQHQRLSAFQRPLVTYSSVDQAFQPWGHECFTELTSAIWRVGLLVFLKISSISLLADGCVYGVSVLNLF